MATSFHQYSPRAQALICLTLAAFAFGAGWQVLLGPEREVVAERQQRLAILDADVTRARQASQRLSEVQASVAALEVALERSTAILPDEKDAQEVLRGLHQLASESNLSINSFTPKPAADQATFTEWPIDLGLEGGYHDIGVFFDRVATEARLISVANLHLKTNTTSDGRRGQVSATCTATTYVFGSPVRPSATAPGGPGTPGSGT